MASYFDEHNCETTEYGHQSQQIDLLRMLRMFLQNDFDGDEDVLQQFLPRGERLAPSASKTVVENLPRRQLQDIDSNADPKCPVCLATFDQDETIIEMPCLHYFHTDCLLPWLQKTNSCPLCRHELETDDPRYEEYKKEKLQEKERELRAVDLHGSMFG